MLAIIAISIALGFVLILFLKRTTSNIAAEPGFYSAQEDLETRSLRTLGPEEFEFLLQQLLEEMGLRVIESEWVNEREIDIRARNPQPLIGADYIVHGILVPEGEVVGSPRVIGLSDTVRAERAAKGILITTGFFSEETAKYQEGAPLELINLPRFKELLKQHHILWPLATE
ncbi:MAG: restriction endonuclease [Nitrospinota bacterium]